MACLTLGFACLFASDSAAQAVDLGDPRQALTQYRIDTWQTEQGLPLNTVQSFEHTSDGYLWVGTAGGLARFDGVSFRTFEETEHATLATNSVLALMEDSRGRLWIGDSERILTWQDGELRIVLDPSVTGRSRTWAFAEESDGTIWSAGSYGLFRIDDSGYERISSEEGLPEQRLRDLEIGPDGRLWIATTGAGLVSFDGESFDVWDTARGFPSGEVRSIEIDAEGGIWAATAGGGLAYLLDGELTVWDEDDGLPTDQTVGLAIDASGSVWFGTWGEGIVRKQGDRFEAIDSTRGLAGDQIWNVFVDREDNVWVGTWVGGLNRLRDRDFVVLGTPEGLSHDNVRSVAHGPDGAAWVTASGGGLNRILDGEITIWDRTDGLPSDEASAVIVDRKGDVWVGTYTSGLARLSDGDLETWDKTTGLPGNDVRVIYQDDDGLIWIGMEKGLVRRSETEFEILDGRGSPSGSVSAILQDGNGTMWFGTTGRGLARLESGQFRWYTRDEGMVSNWIMAIHEDAYGDIWVGTNGEGINRISGEVVSSIRPEDGLPDGVIQTLLEDDEGNLWITGNRGFFRVSIETLREFVEGKIERVDADVYGPGNALRSTTFAGGLQPAGAIDATGRIWLPSFSGLVIVDPENLPGDEPPPEVHLDRIVAGDEILPRSEEVILPPGSVPLSIRYTGTDLTHAERTRFRYRVEGLSDEWVEVGGRRDAFFPTLPAGEFVFHVAASNDGVRWSRDPRTVAITVEPYFWQTRWFILLSALTLIVIVTSLFRMRTSSLQRQKREMERLVAEKTEELRQANEHLEKLSFADPLTGLANRRRFDETLAQEWRRAIRAGRGISLIIADVDRFKRFNDALGHLEGDECLRAVATVLDERVRRAGEMVARFGGEEFVILLPDSSHDDALRFADSLRQAVEETAIPHPDSDVSPVVTISLGVASAEPAHDSEPRDLMKQADEALYSAKAAGRNSVCC